MRGELVSRAVEWRPVPHCPRYEVSSRGDVRKIAPRVHLMKPTLQSTGYHHVTTVNEHGKRVQWSVHRLVATVFIGNPPALGWRSHCAHNDGNKTNNRVENLRWTDAKGNAGDRKRHGTALFGDNHPICKIGDKGAAAVLILSRAGMSQHELARIHGVCRRTIHNIITRKIYRHVQV
jgi:hypothetical protein